MNTIYSIVCVRNGINTETFSGTINDLSVQFSATITHARKIQKEYLKRKIPTKTPTSINKFLQFLNDCTYNVLSDESKIFKLKACD